MSDTNRADQTTPGRSPESVTRGTVFLSAWHVSHAMARGVIHILAGRALAADQYGRFAVALIVLGWTGVFTTAIILPGLKKVISENSDRLRPVLGFGARWYTASLILVAALFCMFAHPLSSLLRDPALGPLFLLVGAQIPLVGGIKAGTVLLPAMRRYTAGSMVGITYSLFAVVGAGTAFFFKQSTLVAMMGILLGAIPATFLSVYLLARERAKAPAVAYGPLAERVRYWTALSLPAVLALGFLSTIDMWCVKGMLPDPTATGLYAAAYSLSRVPLFLAYGLSAAVFPKISEAMEMDDIVAARIVLLKAMRVLLLVFVGIAAIGASSSSEIVTLVFSVRYAAAASSLAILVVASVFASHMQLCLSVIGAADRPAWYLSAVILLASIALLCNVLLIPRLGIEGGAYAMAITFGLGALVGSTMVYRIFRVLPRFQTLTRIAVVAPIVFMLGRVWHPGFALVAPKLIILTLVYGILLIVIREIDRDDWASAKPMVRRLIPHRLA